MLCLFFSDRALRGKGVAVAVSRARNIRSHGEDPYSKLSPCGIAYRQCHRRYLRQKISCQPSNHGLLFWDKSSSTQDAASRSITLCDLTGLPTRDKGAKSQGDDAGWGYSSANGIRCCCSTQNGEGGKQQHHIDKRLTDDHLV